MKTGRIFPFTLALASLVAFTGLTASNAEAFGPPGHGGGWGKGARKGPMMRHLRCVRKLFHAPSFVLKDKLGLNLQQIAKIEKIRDNFAEKRISSKAELARTQLKVRKLLQQDLPQEAQVLQVLRKARTIRGTLKEEKVKAALWMLGTLTPEQRASLRKDCYRRHQMGRFGRGPGHGRGWGGPGHGRGFGPGGFGQGGGPRSGN